MSDPWLAQLVAHRDLGAAQVRAVVQRLLSPETTDVERAALLVAWRGKGETAAEVEQCARRLRELAVPFPGPRADGAVDLCGSGGAAQPSFNFGTVGALVVRAAGLPVAKHGNRSARGSQRGYAGSSDLVDALGLPCLTSRAFAEASYRRHGIAFLHAPLFHPVTRAVMPARSALGIPTVFNLLGPLTNPARVRFQVVGCPDRERAALVATVLPRLGVERGATTVAASGADELSPRGPTQLVAWSAGRRSRRTVRPEQYLDPEDRRGPWGPLPAPSAAEETERILAGGGGARRGGVLLTAGAALWTAGRARSLSDGVRRATEALDSGAAAAVLEALQNLAASRPWSPEA